MIKILNILNKKYYFIFLVGFFCAIPGISSAQFIDTKWLVTGYYGELWFANEKDLLGKHQEFNKGFAQGVFYSCDYAGQSATYNSYTANEFFKNKEFKIGNQEGAFAKVFKESGIGIKNTKVYVHRITCNGKKTIDRKVMYPFVTVGDSNKAFYIYEGAIFTLEFEQ